MFKLYTSQDAKTSILKRTAPDQLKVPTQLLDGIEALFGERLNPADAVRRILNEIRAEGDAALRRWMSTLDAFDRSTYRIPPSTLNAAWEALPASEQDALKLAAERVEQFHRKQPLHSWITQDMGGTIGQMIRPIGRVGLYVPGGTAPLPSSVLMSAIPARVAGVPNVVVVTPPTRGTGEVAGITLAACYLSGVEEVYALGGAQAVGALAYGTETIPAVDKIFGPGNLFVTLAKQQVFGVVGIDGLFGPTETVVIADEHANPAWVAADLLAQAEHDVAASAILLTPSRQMAEAVQVEIGKQIETLSRAETIAVSLENRSGAVITTDLDEAVLLANAYAAEHLCLAVENPWALSEQIQNAGGVFIGEHSFEVLGDYTAGPSHTMPTGGSARFTSPLNVWDFVKIVSLVALDAETGSELSKTAAKLAYAEGLDAHAKAAERRIR